MRIALLYPPPWKIPAAGGAPDASGDGPPPEAAGIEMKGDFATVPYGLLSLAAQALREGHQVKVLNLSTFPWPDVEALVRGLTADVYGLTCFTSNRRGVKLVAECIRRHHGGAHVVVVGPHVSALPTETLRNYPAIDTVVIGEGEETFLELIGRLEAGQSTEGIAGTAWRAGEAVRAGERRERISDLDGLAPVQDYFTGYTLLTSRGCFGRCTFCASQAMWHRKLRFHSVEYVLEALEEMLSRLPLKMIAVKDDTFTANRRRALAICRAIRGRGLNFLWSCDTRADVLDDELLRALRLAGCQRISLGVESGSPKILKNIRKNIDLAQVLEVTRLAKKHGLRVRYYMMAGNRGESARTFQESLRLLEIARPHEYNFTVLSVYPGTTEFEILQRRERFLRVRPGRSGPELLTWRGRFSAGAFFEHDFVEFSAFPDARPADAAAILRWLRTLTAWLDAGGPKSGRPLEVAMRHDFEIIPEDRQPVRPGPLPADCCEWPVYLPSSSTMPSPKALPIR